MPHDVRAEFERAAALHREGKLDKAIAIYRKLAKTQPSLFDVKRLLVFAQLQAGLVKDALATARKVCDAHPANAHAQLLLGASLQAAGRLEKALSAYENAALLAPSLAEAHYLTGNMLGALGEHAKAVERFTRVLQIDPRTSEALLNRASALRRLGRPEEALQDYERLSAMLPWEPRYLIQSAELLTTLGRFGEAAAAAAQAARIAPHNADAHAVLGAVRLAEGDLKGALFAFEVAAARAPDRMDLRACIIDIQRRLGNFSAAYAATAAALEQAPADPVILFARASLRTEDGNPVGALQDVEAALAAVPEWEEAAELRDSLVAVLSGAAQVQAQAQTVVNGAAPEPAADSPDFETDDALSLKAALLTDFGAAAAGAGEDDAAPDLRGPSVEAPAPSTGMEAPAEPDTLAEADALALAAVLAAKEEGAPPPAADGPVIAGEADGAEMDGLGLAAVLPEAAEAAAEAAASRIAEVAQDLPADEADALALVPMFAEVPDAPPQAPANLEVAASTADDTAPAGEAQMPSADVPAPSGEFLPAPPVASTDAGAVPFALDQGFSQAADQESAGISRGGTAFADGSFAATMHEAPTPGIPDEPGFGASAQGPAGSGHWSATSADVPFASPDDVPPPITPDGPGDDGAPVQDFVEPGLVGAASAGGLPPSGVFAAAAPPAGPHETAEEAPAADAGSPADVPVADVAPPSPDVPPAGEPDPVASAGDALAAALAALASGRWAEGWTGYGHRPVATLQGRRWDGQFRPGRLVVVVEGETADTLLLARLLRTLADSGTPVTLLGAPGHLPLLGRLDPRVRVVTTPQEAGLDEAGLDEAGLDEAGTEAADVAWVPLGDLPRLIAPDPAAWPRPPYLPPDPARVARWRGVLDSAAVGAGLEPEALTIGLAWTGDTRAGVPIVALAPLAGVPGVRLVTLGAAARLHGVPFAERIAHLDLDPDDAAGLADIAALLQHIDLLVTDAGPFAHIAGARARPAFVAVEAEPHWSWGTAGPVTPHYPNLRLFRQAHAGEWGDVAAEMAQALVALLHRE